MNRNHLTNQSSPYLRMHESNPVHWYPWGDEALNAASSTKRPILLSIGYSACHWCHVMERESFSDSSTAEVMNALYINVKVDREERPDIDSFYVEAVQKMGKRPGWPLTVFLRPDGKPFWGGTYFPNAPRAGLPAFKEVLQKVRELYDLDPIAIDREASRLSDTLSRRVHERIGTSFRDSTISGAAKTLLADFDQQTGGLKGSSKFPYPTLLRFLWNEGHFSGEAALQRAALLSVEEMLKGGIYDQVGGGFFRYTVDSAWRVPHFEKMLCDNALLLAILCDMERATKRRSIRQAVERTADWLLRELRLEGGAFATSQEADSEGVEGGHYLWSEAEIDEVLGEHSHLFKQTFGVTNSGNFNGANILARFDELELERYSEEQIAQDLDLLRARRAQRSPPGRIGQVLTDWNGMTIAALAKASVLYAKPEWLEAATAAFAFVRLNLGSEDRLCHSWTTQGVGSGEVLDDYANMISAAIALHEATGKDDFLQVAQAWARRCVRDFKPASGGAFHHTARSSNFAFATARHARDTSVPSANGVLVRCLSQLYYLTGDDHYRLLAEDILNDLAPEIETEGYQMATFLDAARFLRHATSIKIVGSTIDESMDALLRAAIVAAPVYTVLQSGVTASDTDSQLGFGTTSAAFVCIDQTCSLPLKTVEELTRVLDTITERKQ